MPTDPLVWAVLAAAAHLSGASWPHAAAKADAMIAGEFARRFIQDDPPLGPRVVIHIGPVKEQ